MQNTGEDIIDCVDINRQPSLKHPLFRDHKIKVSLVGITNQFLNHQFTITHSMHTQLKPWRPNLEKEEASKRSSRVETWQRADQSWRQSGGVCPQGTVPIRRTPDEGAVDLAVADDALRLSFSNSGAAEDRIVLPQDGAAAAGPRIEVRRVDACVE